MVVSKEALNDLLSHAKKGGGSNSGINWMKVGLNKGVGKDNNTFVIRLLPGDPTIFSADIHYFRFDGEMKPTVCPKDFDNGCPSCDIFFAAHRYHKEEGLEMDEDVRNVLKKLNSRTRYYANIVDRRDNNIKVFSMPPSLFEEIQSAADIQKGFGINVLDPEKGRDLYFNLKPQGYSYTYTSVSAHPENSEVGVDNWEKLVFDLRKAAHQAVMSSDEIEEVIPSVLGDEFSTQVLNWYKIELEREKESYEIVGTDIGEEI